jgi:hypothetical protein
MALLRRGVSDNDNSACGDSASSRLLHGSPPPAATLLHARLARPASMIFGALAPEDGQPARPPCTVYARVVCKKYANLDSRW